MLILTTTAAAHTVTLDSGTFNNETHSEVLGFAAAIGNCVKNMAVNGAWIVTLKGIPRYSAAAPAIVAGFRPKCAWMWRIPRRWISGTRYMAPRK